MDGIDDRFARRLSGWARSLPPGSIISIPPSILADQLRPTAPELIASEGLLRAQKAWASALELWQDEDDAFEFLIRKHAMLEDRRPIVAAMDSNEGLRSVRSIIGRLRYGSAA